MKFKIVIPTLNAITFFESLTSGLLLSPNVFPEDVLIVDSSSDDGTAEKFLEWGANVVQIERKDFNHGGTRRMAVRLCEGVDVVIFMTQDAIPFDSQSFENILLAFEDPKVGVAYGCQLPRLSASGVEAHARWRNYPPELIESRSLNDKGQFKIKTVFCSDSFAAYRVSALESVGGMPEEAFFGEDQIVAAKMLISGWLVSYRGDAKVFHSHAYTILEEFKRYFDVGVFHARNMWMLDEFGMAEGEGIMFVKSELSYLWANSKKEILGSVLRVFAKYAGYRIGLLESKIPNSLKRKLSMSSFYWKAR